MRSPALKDRATVEFLADLPTGAVLKRLGELGGDALVFTPSYFQDGEGRHVMPRETVEAMVAAATAPVYGPFTPSWARVSSAAICLVSRSWGDRRDKS